MPGLRSAPNAPRARVRRDGEASAPDVTRLLTIPEAVALLHDAYGYAMRRTRLYELIRNGIMPAVHVGRHVRLQRAVLDEWLRAGGGSYARRVVHPAEHAATVAQ